MATNNYYKITAPFILFIIALFLLFKLVQPMIVVLLSSALLAYISFPVYQRISKKINNKSISIVLSLFVVIIIILIPFSFLTFEITQQGYYFYHSLSGGIAKGALFGLGCTSADSEVCLLLNQAEKFSLEKLTTLGFDKQVQKFLPVLEEKIANFIISIPVIIAQIFLTIIISYFILKEWETISEKIIELLPMRAKTIKKLIKEFGDIAHTVIYAQLFVALVQGIVGAIGFYIFGLPFPLFFGVLMAFCALIPAIGTAIIWIPASLFLMLSGYFSHNYWILGNGIGLFLYSILIISTIDNILLAKIVHTRVKVNQIIVIIGVVGGASMFGIVGIFIGPILLPLLITYFKTFKEKFD